MRVTVSDEQLNKAFEMIKDNTSFAESARLHAQGQRGSEMLQALSLRPEILRTFGDYAQCLYPGGLVERSVKELVILEASRRNACQFCADSHTAVARMLGISDDPIRLLDEPQRMSDRERLAVEYTVAAMQDSNRVPNELFDRLREHYTEPELVEVTFLIGYINCLNIFNNCLRVTYHGEFEAFAPQESPAEPRGSS